jgi:hypothetical protein
VHATYTTAAAALQSGDGNHAWGQILNEVNSLRIVEGSTGNYFGVVHTTYNSGVAGLGYVGLPAAIGWDFMPSGDGVVAHELGHNFSLSHAPCGGASSPDAAYPYANAVIGTYGLDPVTMTLHSANDFDLMSYCDPDWVSDYNYNLVFGYRTNHPFIAHSTAAAERVMLVWGRISNDEVLLEPAFTVVTRPVMPSRSGPYRIEGVDAQGASTLSLSFAADEVADSPNGDRLFSFAVPISEAMENRTTELRLIAPGRAPRALRSLSAAPGASQSPAAPSPRVTVVGGAARLTWDASTHPMALVRDARTGQVLSFGRDGLATVPNVGELEVVFSDRVHSTSVRVQPR